MQQPEQWQQHEQTWQEYEDSNSEHGERNRSEQQQEFRWARDGGNYQRQKIYPQEKLVSRRKVRSILTIILSSLGLCLSAAGFLLSLVVLNYANGREDRLAEGTIGQISSIVIMLICIIVLVTNVIILAMRASKVHRHLSPSS